MTSNDSGLNRILELAQIFAYVQIQDSDILGQNAQELFNLLSTRNNLENPTVTLHNQKSDTQTHSSGTYTQSVVKSG